MRLLLETLDADRDRFRDLHDIYAIERGTAESASLWKAKGIKPIEFADYDGIYNTLSEWARFATQPPGNNLLSGLHAVLHAKPKRQLQGWDAHREISLAARPYVSARADAANTT